ncbi:MAG: DNA polymerase ligase N-terminal domain-containing protein [Planctomycetaceae bacterium]
MPRYVVLTHDHPALHWDLMLECGDVLRTWRLNTPPVEGEIVLAEAIPDHRRMYLDYEGPVSHNRGTVSRWDCGSYEGDVDDDNRIEIDVRGEKLSGRLSLNRRDAANVWELEYTVSSNA